MRKVAHACNLSCRVVDHYLNLFVWFFFVFHCSQSSLQAIASYISYCQPLEANVAFFENPCWKLDHVQCVFYDQPLGKYHILQGGEAHCEEKKHK